MRTSPKDHVLYNNNNGRTVAKCPIGWRNCQILVSLGWAPGHKTTRDKDVERQRERQRERERRIEVEGAVKL